jgi:hypothetical protein
MNAGRVSRIEEVLLLKSFDANAELFDIRRQ